MRMHREENGLGAAVDMAKEAAIHTRRHTV